MSSMYGQISLSAAPSIQYEILPPSQSSAVASQPFPAGHYGSIAPAATTGAPDLQIQYEQLPATDVDTSSAQVLMRQPSTDALNQWQQEVFSSAGGADTSAEKALFSSLQQSYAGAGALPGGHQPLPASGASQYQPAQHIVNNRQQKLPVGRQYDVAGPIPSAQPSRAGAVARPTSAEPSSPRKKTNDTARVARLPTASTAGPATLARGGSGGGSAMSRGRCVWCEVYPPVGKVKYQEQYLRLCTPCIDAVKRDRNVASQIVSKLLLWEQGTRLLCESCRLNTAYCKAKIDGVLKKVCTACLGRHPDFVRSLQQAETMLAERSRLNEVHTTLLELNTMSPGHQRVLIALCRCELLLQSVDSAFERLSQALAACYFEFQILQDDPVYAPLRAMPGYAQMIAQYKETKKRLMGSAEGGSGGSGTTRQRKPSNGGIGGGGGAQATVRRGGGDFRKAPWYSPTMDRSGAEAFLLPQKAGAFVVRPCSVAGHVSLSHKKPAKAGGGVGHCMVKIHDGKGFSVENATEMFGTMEELLKSLPGVDFRNFAQ